MFVKQIRPHTPITLVCHTITYICCLLDSKTLKYHITIVTYIRRNHMLIQVTHTPAEDPQIILKEAERQEGEIGRYHPLSNNCDNFAGNNTGYASQALAFFHWLKTLILNMSAKALTTQLAGIFDDVIKSVVEFSATAGTLS